MNIAVAVSGGIRTFAQNASGLDAMFRQAAGTGVVDWFGSLDPTDREWLNRWKWYSVAMIPRQRNPNLSGMRIYYNANGTDLEQRAWMQWQGIRSVCALIRFVEEARGFRYDWIVRCRPDLRVDKPIEPFETLWQDCIYAPGHDNWGGVNDRIFFGPSVLMEQAMKFGDSACEFFMQPDHPDRGNRNPECVLGWHLRRIGIKRRFTAGVFSLVRTTGEVVPPAWKPEQGDEPKP